jgi:hypothetical protein
MTGDLETEVVVVAAAGGPAQKEAKRAANATPPRAPGSDPFAANLLLHGLAQRLLEVEEWCRCHSEYFLG